MTKGLPGSGKSTWAEAKVRAHAPGTVVRVNKDALRQMLHADVFDGAKTESQIEQARDALICVALADKKVRIVISDDTNFGKHERRLRQLAATVDAEFRIHDLTSVDVDLCVERDLKRQRSVGERVIREMWCKYVLPQSPLPRLQRDPSLQDAVVFDVDGTLAHMTDRGPYDFDRIGEDAVDEMIRDIAVGEKAQGRAVIIVTGRDARYLEQTREWLSKHGVPWDEIFCRAEGDARNDAVVKTEIYERSLKSRYNVRYAIDDRDRVVDAWRKLGILTLQCAPGTF